MVMEERESGLFVPKQEPEPPKRRYAPLELQDEERRALASEALSKLWDAMSLSAGGGIRLPGQPSVTDQEAYSHAYRFIGEMLLGEDCPEKEVMT